MQLRPLAGHVYVEAIAPAESKGLIVIPDSVKREEQTTGKIVAVAEHREVVAKKTGVERILMSVSAGQYALFRPRSGDVFAIKGRTFYNVHEDDILLVTDSEEDFQQLSQPAT